MADDNESPKVNLSEIEQSLELEYPCRWLYKVVGTDAALVREAALEVIDNESVTIEPSRTSSKGTYVSFNVEVTVQDAEERTGIYEALKAHSNIRMVL
jgi:putative lipoic acid-binding regulatory protein